MDSWNNLVFLLFFRFFLFFSLGSFVSFFGSSSFPFISFFFLLGFRFVSFFNVLFFYFLFSFLSVFQEDLNFDLGLGLVLPCDGSFRVWQRRFCLLDGWVGNWVVCFGAEKISFLSVFFFLTSNKCMFSVFLEAFMMIIYPH